MKSSFFADLVTGISGFLFCLSLSIVLILHFRPLYVQEIKDQKLSTLSSMSEAEILEQYDALIHYNSLFYRGELHFPSLPMSEEGRIHFSEVKKIFDAIQLLLIFSAAMFLPLAFFRIWKRRFVFFRIIPSISAVLAFLAAFGAILDWDSLFTAFHKLVFRNDYWLFDPDTDPVINLLPDSYFLHCLAGILVLLLFFSLLSAFLWHYFSRKER